MSLVLEGCGRGSESQGSGYKELGYWGSGLRVNHVPLPEGPFRFLCAGPRLTEV